MSEDLNWLHETNDAMKWAEECTKVLEALDYIDIEEIDIDEVVSILHTWFANVMCVATDNQTAVQAIDHAVSRAQYQRLSEIVTLAPCLIYLTGSRKPYGPICRAGSGFRREREANIRSNSSKILRILRIFRGISDAGTGAAISPCKAAGCVCVRQYVVVLGADRGHHKFTAIYTATLPTSKPLVPERGPAGNLLDR